MEKLEAIKEILKSYPKNRMHCTSINLIELVMKIDKLIELDEEEKKEETTEERTGMGF